MRVAAWNVQGVKSTVCDESVARQVKELFEKVRVDVLFLSEVWLKGTEEDRCVAMAGEDSKVWDEAMAGAFSMFDGFQLSLNTNRRAGTALLWKSSFRPLRIFTYLPRMETLLSPNRTPVSKCHENEGRIILAEFDSFLILFTYTPNNGYNDNSFKRRQQWDYAIMEWCKAVKGCTKKPLILGGDMNCAPTDWDLSHAGFFKSQHPSPPNPGHRGQPGCTPLERQRFHELLNSAGLEDAFRVKQQLESDKSEFFSWGPKRNVGKFAGKGMRIDHFLVDKAILSDVSECRLLVQADGRQDGAFLESDHVPICLALNSTTVV